MDGSALLLFTSPMAFNAWKFSCKVMLKSYRLLYNHGGALGKTPGGPTGFYPPAALSGEAFEARYDEAFHKVRCA